MRTVLCLVVCVTLARICKAVKEKKQHEMIVTELINVAGYPNETYAVYTEDDYILQLHRIPGGRRFSSARNQHSDRRKNAILIMHGVAGSSGDFVVMGPGRSLAYLLADAGYDVWLGNLRGTIYSSHKIFTKQDPRFWDYSFHEHGVYDSPAIIDKILDVTGLSKLMYIGYSMGATTFFTMMSERPEYNDKITNFIALAPAVYLDNLRPHATFVLRIKELTEQLRSLAIISNYLGLNPNYLLIGDLCKLSKLDICINLIFMLVGEDYEQLDQDIYSTIMKRIQPTTWRQFEHFAKIAISGVFTSWEGGLWNNVRPYNISNVRVPVTLLYGENDKLTEKPQIQRLANQLSATGMLERMSDVTGWPKFNHLDFLFAREVDLLLNKPLVKLTEALFNKYGPN